MLGLPKFQGKLMDKLYLIKRGKEIGRETPQIGVNPIKTGKNQRKLVILPAKPPPRKTQSVMRSTPKEIERVQGRTDRNHSQKRAESGVYEELNRIEQVNSALTGKMTTSNYMKAKKNFSFECNSLITHEPMNDYICTKRHQDQKDYMSA